MTDPFRDGPPPGTPALLPLGVVCDHQGGFTYWCSTCRPTDKVIQEAVAEAHGALTRALQYPQPREREHYIRVAMAALDPDAQPRTGHQLLADGAAQVLPVPCTGARDCQATVHIEGCFAEVRRG